ncbi:MAG: phage holin family protein [Acidobacteria bacterium]|jgi:putative membrane protein|nr:phage holin family protein [Acidobacteriota bacterium]
MRLILAIVGNAIALWATTVVPGITFTGTWLQLALAGAIFGLLNLIVRPLALILSIPALILTLGLFYFVLNALLLWGFSRLLPGYAVSGFWPALGGSLVLMVVNWVLSGLFGKTKDD